ncbi:DNase I-like protein, partial [Artomyces pyxidatus]
RRAIRKRTKATLTIATLNMKGKSAITDPIPLNKWREVNNMMKQRRIGVLALQETHLTQLDVEAINRMYGRRLQIHYSSNPTNANQHGVAIVLNRELTNTMGVKETDLIPGRATLLRIPWHATLIITILNVYAPNDPHENAAFWASLHAKWTTLRLPSPDILCGDFNLVENAADRAPPHCDAEAATTALSNLTDALYLRDGWRTVYPDTRNYTFSQPNGRSLSRIDRIYAADHVVENALDWTIETCPVPSDHLLVTVTIKDRKAPYVGRGRWTMPLHLTTDHELMSTAQTRGAKLLRDIKTSLTQRTATRNAQTLFEEFKDDILAKAKKRARTAPSKVELALTKLQADRLATIRDPAFNTDPALREHAGILLKRIAQLTHQKNKFSKAQSAAHYRIEGEHPSKYWSSINIAKTP